MPDSEILRCKGPPILNDAERLKLVDSVKWVDEVLTGESCCFVAAVLPTKHRGTPGCLWCCFC